MPRRPSLRFALTTLLALAPACGRAPEEAPRAEVPTFAIPAGCAPETIHCESSAPLGLRDGRGHGRGVSLVDVDGDGWTDIWRSDSGRLTDEGVHRAGLYRNNGDGTFEAWDVGIAPEH